MIWTATIEPDGRLALWAPEASFPVLVLEDWEAEDVARALLAALSDQKWAGKV